MEGLRNLPLGQYVKGDSFLHRLDPRTKIGFTFLYLIFLFVTDSPLGVGLYAAISLAAIGFSRLSLRYLWQGFRGMLIFILLLGAFQLFLIREGEVWWSWGKLTLYSEGVKQAALLSIRLLLVIMMTSLLTLTTSPAELTCGLERMLRPLGRFGFPAHEFALMMTISIRFIPTLLEEAEKIIKAQTARGADFESRNWRRRGEALLSLFVPLFVNAFRRAEELALAMEARGYRGQVGRSHRRTLRFTWKDYLVLSAMAALAGITFVSG